jgi:hypothetical protein
MAAVSAVLRRGLPRRWGALAAIGLVAVLGAGLFVWGGGDDGGGDARPASTTIDAGDLEIAAPDGWDAIPLPALGFGLALPSDWESVVLSAEGLERLADAAPAVPGFVDAAHNAAASGAVLYAASADAEGRVTDLKVRAAAETGVTDAAGLEAYAGELATAAQLPDPTVTVVEGAEWPTVDVRYSAPAAEGGDSPTQGTERSVLAPSGVVYSFLVTSEDPAGHDDLAEQLFGTLELSDEAPPAGETP